MKQKEIEDRVYSYQTKDDRGFTSEEMVDLLKQFPKLKADKFDNAMRGNTCALNDKGQVLTYHCDIVRGIQCGLENRELKSWEWD